MLATLCRRNLKNFSSLRTLDLNLNHYKGLSFRASARNLNMSAPTTPNIEPPVGMTKSYEVAVQPTDLASEIAADASSDRFPRVLATSRLVAFMEIAAARVLQPYLGEAELSVGTRVDITHLAPTSIGSKVIAQARFLEKKEKMFLFEVSAKDEAGEVGRGIHERVIVETARLEGRALKRNGSVV